MQSQSNYLDSKFSARHAEILLSVRSQGVNPAATSLIQQLPDTIDKTPMRCDELSLESHGLTGFRPERALQFGNLSFVFAGAVVLAAADRPMDVTGYLDLVWRYLGTFLSPLEITDIDNLAQASRPVGQDQYAIAMLNVILEATEGSWNAGDSLATKVATVVVLMMGRIDMTSMPYSRWHRMFPEHFVISGVLTSGDLSTRWKDSGLREIEGVMPTMMIKSEIPNAHSLLLDSLREHGMAQNHSKLRSIVYMSIGVQHCNHIVKPKHVGDNSAVYYTVRLNDNHITVDITDATAVVTDVLNANAAVKREDVGPDGITCSARMAVAMIAILSAIPIVASAILLAIVDWNSFSSWNVDPTSLLALASVVTATTFVILQARYARDWQWHDFLNGRLVTKDIAKVARSVGVCETSVVALLYLRGVASEVLSQKNTCYILKECKGTMVVPRPMSVQHINLFEGLVVKIGDAPSAVMHYARTDTHELRRGLISLDGDLYHIYDQDSVGVAQAAGAMISNDLTATEKRTLMIGAIETGRR